MPINIANQCYALTTFSAFYPNYIKLEYVKKYIITTCTHQERQKLQSSHPRKLA